MPLHFPPPLLPLLYPLIPFFFLFLCFTALSPVSLIHTSHRDLSLLLFPIIFNFPPPFPSLMFVLFSLPFTTFPPFPFPSPFSFLPSYLTSILALLPFPFYSLSLSLSLFLFFFFLSLFLFRSRFPVLFPVFFSFLYPPCSTLYSRCSFRMGTKITEKNPQLSGN
jgi:hypothetical protein